MHIPGEKIVPMDDCDHSTICRFDAETSLGYKTIFGILQEWARGCKES
jgi:hypothetical protein